MTYVLLGNTQSQTEIQNNNNNGGGGGSGEVSVPFYYSKPKTLTCCKKKVLIYLRW